MALSAIEVNYSIVAFDEKVEEDNYDEYEDFFAVNMYNAIYESDWNIHYKKAEGKGLQLSVGLAQLVDSGRDNDEVWFVFSIGNQLFRMATYYSSYDSTNWSDSEAKEVKAQEKIITVYEEV